MNTTEQSDSSAAELGRRQVFRAAGLVAALALLSRVLGLAREIVVRQYLGVSTLEATAFDIAGRFPETIFLIVAVAHLLRVALQWEFRVGGWDAPSWVSLIAVLVAGFLGYTGLRCASRLT